MRYSKLGIFYLTKTVMIRLSKPYRKLNNDFRKIDYFATIKKAQTHQYLRGLLEPVFPMFNIALKFRIRFFTLV